MIVKENQLVNNIYFCELLYGMCTFSVEQAWGELADIEREQERWTELRGHIEQKLEACRQRGIMLEDVRLLIIKS